ncbi:DUF5339 family protein [Mesocricetibacter intestinalis]|uniref:DUF5339 family protein n=1 Tax=Mesocricetibacter intestinalis TaxID=1521930 RepID=UPI00105CBA77|nr:DUF5339 family protein [Mesocricetibacter intestinalis]
MQKYLLSSILCLAAFSATAADLHPSCQEYFKAAEAYAAKVPEVKAQFDAAKSQYATLPQQAQETACKQALDALKQMPPAK